MSSHGIKFLDLRDCPYEEQFDRLEEEVELLSIKDSLVVILSFNPNPFFKELTDSPSYEEEAFCFNHYQIDPETCVGSITPAKDTNKTGQDPISSDTYSSIFAGLPMDN